jgi:methyltransferase
MNVLWWLLGAIAVQRVVELAYAERNTRALRARGATELAAWQHPLFVALHAAWLLSMLVFIPPSTPPNWWIVAVVALAQVARVWIIASLGPYWTTRVITLEREPLVRKGPYAFFPHPNYAIVCLEIALVPAAFSAWRIAVVFTVMNALLVMLRLRVENRALDKRRDAAWHT